MEQQKQQQEQPKNDFTLIVNDAEYSISVKKDNNKIIIEAKEKVDDIPFYYTLNLEFAEFKKINNIFLCMDSIDETIIFLENIFSKKESIQAETDETDENLIIQGEYDLCSLKKNIIISLPKIITSDKKMCEYLIKQNKKSKKEISKLKTIIKSKGISLEEYKDIDTYQTSKLITSDKQLNLIKSGILDSKNKDLKLKLLYIASQDGDTPDAFHSKCDGKAPTLTVFKTKNDLIFGGYTDVKWDKISESIKGKNTFLFSFNNMKIYKGKDGGQIYCSKEHGPWFSYALGVHSNSFLKTKETSQYDFNLTKSHWKHFDKEYEITGGKKDFYVSEIEVFQIELTEMKTS